MLMPKRVKRRKVFRGRMTGKATKGKIWIHNDTQTKMVLPTEAPGYLVAGWVLGRGKIKR